MTDTSQVQTRYFTETTWNETPSTGNKMVNLNITSNSLAGSNATKKSGILRSDANVAKIGRVDKGTGGGLGLELIYGEFDPFLAGLLRSAFGTTFTTTGTGIAFVASGNHITDSANGFTNVIAGQFIYVTGAATAGNNGYHKVVTKASAGDITVATTLTNGAAGPSVTVKGTLMKNGTTEKSFLIESQFSSSLFDYHRGMEVASGQLNFALEDFVTGSFDFIGKSCTRATATQGDGAPTAASALDSMNTIDNLKVFIDGVLTTLDVTAFNFNISPALRPKKALGNLGPIGIGGGTFTITGGIDIHNSSNSLLSDFDNFTTKSLALQVADAAGNAQVYDFPAVKFGSGNRNAQGQDQDVISSLGFECQLDSTIAGMIGITRIPA